MRTDRTADFARLAKERRRRLGYTQQQLANIVGVTRQLIARFERGEGDPSLGVTLRILAALGLEFSVGERDAPASTSRPSSIDVPRLDVSGLIAALQSGAESDDAAPERSDA